MKENNWHAVEKMTIEPHLEDVRIDSDNSKDQNTGSKHVKQHSNNNALSNARWRVGTTYSGNDTRKHRFGAPEERQHERVILIIPPIGVRGVKLTKPFHRDGRTSRNRETHT
jgi:hypothetical protein